jgi:Flp pilus assembly protein TadG
MTGLVIDLTNLYTRRAIAQRASDAAALAGALISTNDTSTASGSNDDAIIREAKDYANRNGYTDAQTTVDPHVAGQLGKVAVTVGRNERVFFTPVLEFLLGDNPAYSRRVVSSATAEKIVVAPLDLGGDYGTTTGASNPSAFGPQSKHSYGDPYSTMYYDDGTLNDKANVGKNKGTGWDPNSSFYNPDGFSYTMKVTPDFAAKNSTLRVQLYDPDGYDSKDGQSLDEIHTDYAAGHPPNQAETTTRYTIYKVGAGGALTQVKSVEYGNDQSSDAAYLKSQNQDPWVTPDGFKIDLAQYGSGDYKIRVKTLDGSSENGYNLRAGPDYTGIKSETDWNNQYGDKAGSDPANVAVPIKADGNLQMNFTRTAPVKVRLGYLPKDVAGKQMVVTKFDTDVGSKNIRYSYVEDGGTSKYSGGSDFLDNSNDTWSQNTVDIPSDFKGGYWYAEYDAGQNDTSSWSIKYPGLGNGTVKLVK